MGKIFNKTIGNRTLFKVLYMAAVMTIAVPYLHEKTGPYIKLFLVWGAVLVFMELVRTKGKMLWDKSVLLLLLFCFFYGVTILVTRNREMGQSINGLIYMGMTFLLVFCPQQGLGREAFLKDVKAVVCTVIGGTFLFSAACIVTYILQINIKYTAEGTVAYIGMYDHRLWGLYNPNVGATLAVVSLVLTAFAIVEIQKRWFRIFAACNLAIQFVMIILAASRTVTYGTLAFLFFFLVYLLPRISPSQFRNAGFGGLLKKAAVSGVVVIGLFLVVQAGTRGFGQMTKWLQNQAEAAELQEAIAGSAGTGVLAAATNRTDVGVDSKGGILNGRQYIWQAGIYVWKQAPVLGVTKEAIYRVGRNQVEILTFRRAFRRGGLHNIYLTVLAASGIVGFCTLLLLLLYGIKRIWKYSKTIDRIYGNGWYLAAAFLVVLYLGMECFEARILYELNINFLLFWTMAGIVKGFHQIAAEEQKGALIKAEKTAADKPEDGKLHLTAFVKLHRRFLENTSWLLFDKMFQMVLSLVVMSITARYLGKDNYGILNYGLAFVNIFTSVCKLGIDAVLVNEMIKDRDKTGEFIGTTIGLRMASGFCSVILTGVFVWVLKPGEWIVLGISLVQAVSLLFVAFDTIDYYFQSRLKSKYSTISKSAAYVLVSVIRLVLVLLRANVMWFAIATVADAAAIAVGLLIFYKKEKMGFAFSMATAKYLLKVAGPYLLANLLVVIYTQMDKIMVGSMNTDSEVGIYTAAMNIANMWMFIPLALIDSARPLIMEYKQQKDAKYMSRYRQLTGIVIWISIAAGIVLTIFPKLCIRILYGSDYLGAVPVLMLLIWSRLFSLLGTTRSIWLICENLSRYVKWFVGIGAVVNLVLNACWIPMYGASGAAAATLITEFVGAIVLPACFKETRPIIGIVARSLKIW